MGVLTLQVSEPVVRALRNTELQWDLYGDVVLVRDVLDPQATLASLVEELGVVDVVNYPSLCSSCVMVNTVGLMSGFVGSPAACDGCGHITELAITRHNVRMGGD